MCARSGGSTQREGGHTCAGEECKREDLQRQADGEAAGGAHSDADDADEAGVHQRQQAAEVRDHERAAKVQADGHDNPAPWRVQLHVRTKRDRDDARFQRCDADDKREHPGDGARPIERVRHPPQRLGAEVEKEDGSGEEEGDGPEVVRVEDVAVVDADVEERRLEGEAEGDDAGLAGGLDSGCGGARGAGAVLAAEAGGGSGGRAAAGAEGGGEGGDEDGDERGTDACGVEGRRVGAGGDDGAYGEQGGGGGGGGGEDDVLGGVREDGVLKRQEPEL